MSASVILNIPELAQNQNNRYITINNAIAYLEGSANAKLSKTVSGTSDVALTEDECTRYGNIVCSGGSGNFNLVLRGEINSVNANRMVLVRNATSNTMTVKSDAAGTTVVVATGGAALIHQDHDDITLLLAYFGTTVPYDFGTFIAGQPDDAATVFELVAVRAIDLPDDFSGSRGHVGTNPTSSASFDVLKNGSSIGSVVVSTGGVFTFSTTGGAVSLAAGDRISLTAPSPQDATLANVSIFFKGTRTL